MEHIFTPATDVSIYLEGLIKEGEVELCQHLPEWYPIDKFCSLKCDLCIEPMDPGYVVLIGSRVVEGCSIPAYYGVHRRCFIQHNSDVL